MPPALITKLPTTLWSLPTGAWDPCSGKPLRCRSSHVGRSRRAQVLIAGLNFPAGARPRK